MSTDPSTTEQIAAAVMAEHVYVTFGYCGGCEWHADFEHDWDAGDANPYPDQHRAHVAQQIAARLDDGLAGGNDRAARDQRRYDALAEALHKAVLRAESAEAQIRGLRAGIEALVERMRREARMFSRQHYVEAAVAMDNRADDLRGLLDQTRTKADR